jgi:hypothetical protein
MVAESASEASATLALLMMRLNVVGLAVQPDTR